MSDPFFEVHVGCMWSGKSDVAINIGNKYKLSRRRVLGVKPEAALRPGDDSTTISSRTGAKHEGVPVFLPKVGEEELLFSRALHHDVIVVDEGHFLRPMLADVLSMLHDAGKSIVYSCIDVDWRGEPFITTQQLMLTPEAHVVRHLAVCSVCEQPNATRTQKLHHNLPARFTDQALETGDGELYRPVCRRCYVDTYIHVGMPDLVIRTLPRAS